MGPSTAMYRPVVRSAAIPALSGEIAGPTRRVYGGEPGVSRLRAARVPAARQPAVRQRQHLERGRERVVGGDLARERERLRAGFDDRAAADDQVDVLRPQRAVD